MKKFIYLFLVAVATITLNSCGSSDDDTLKSLKGTKWSQESSQSLSMGTEYSYYVWEFFNDSTANEVRYTTGTTKVDYVGGDDPAKYGTIDEDWQVVVHLHGTFPNFTSYTEHETLTAIGKEQDKDYDASVTISEYGYSMDIHYNATGITRTRWRVRK